MTTNNDTSAEREAIVRYLEWYQGRISAAPERSSVDLIARAGMIGAEKALKLAREAIEAGDHLKEQDHDK